MSDENRKYLLEKWFSGKHDMPLDERIFHLCRLAEDQEEQIILMGQMIEDCHKVIDHQRPFREALDGVRPNEPFETTGP